MSKRIDGWYTIQTKECYEYLSNSENNETAKKIQEDSTSYKDFRVKLKQTFKDLKLKDVSVKEVFLEFKYKSISNKKPRKSKQMKEAEVAADEVATVEVQNAA